MELDNYFSQMMLTILVLLEMEMLMEKEDLFILMDHIMMDKYLEM